MDWTISDAATTVLSRAIDDFVRDYGAPGFDYYPVVTWRSGGQLFEPDGAVVDLPDCYDLGLIPREDINASRFLPIAHETFGIVAFVPRAEDAASSRRTIDYDGETIVVR